MIPVFLILHTEANPFITDKPRFLAVNDYHRSGSKAFPKSSLGYYCGYTYFVERNGEAIQARKDDEIGAHIIGYNDKSIGICFAGNGDLQLPTPAQTVTLGRLVQEKMKLWNIPKENVKCHRDYDKMGKTCPGILVTNEWIRLNLVEQLFVPTPSPKPPEMHTITRKYEAVEINRLREKISILQKLILLFSQRNKLKLGSMSNFSQTQLSNINTFAGLLVMLLPKLGIVVSYEQLVFFIGALWSVGWTIYNYYQRYQRGDLFLGGSRK